MTNKECKMTLRTTKDYIKIRRNDGANYKYIVFVINYFMCV